jgi:hypothetical protein
VCIWLDKGVRVCVCLGKKTETKTSKKEIGPALGPKARSKIELRRDNGCASERKTGTEN